MEQNGDGSDTSAVVTVTIVLVVAVRNSVSGGGSDDSGDCGDRSAGSDFMLILNFSIQDSKKTVRVSIFNIDWNFVCIPSHSLRNLGRTT
jgi:hypothetical protein